MPASLHACAFASLDTSTLYALLRLRVDVFVVEQACAYPELDGRDTEPATRHVWAAVERQPVAYLRLLAEPDGTDRIGRVCVDRGHRREGLAALVMAEALRLAGGTTLVLDAQSHLQSWYEGQGFVVTGPEFVEDGIPHVPMRRSAGG